MNIKNRIKLFLMKRKARKIYYRLIDIQDKYGCGVQLVSYINPEFSLLDKQLRELVKEIKKINGK